MRFALVDDRTEERELILELLFSFAKDNNLTFHADNFKSGEEFLAAFVPYSYDIVFLDIYMDGITGIETAAKMRETDSRTLIIFLTTSQEHMGDAFSIHAFDYVKKPIEKQKFFTCLTDAMRLLPKPNQYLSFLSNGTPLRLFYNDICFLRSFTHSIEITIISGKTYSVYASFSTFTKPLMEQENFLLVSRGILVNMDYVTGFTAKECTLQNGISVPITMRKQKQLTCIWHNYNFAKLHREATERSR